MEDDAQGGVDLEELARGLAGLSGSRDELLRFMLTYKFAMDSVMTKVQILREEYTLVHAHNPIEHVTARLKRPENLLAKAARQGTGLDLPSLRAHVRDIAGVRITCAFVTDVYSVYGSLVRQGDIRLLGVKDYIATPKPNGYRSLHAVVEVPVFLSDGPVHVPVEIQFRTIAMDFWASLEHRTYYKYEKDVPGALVDDLREAADTAARLDADMERIHRLVHGAPGSTAPPA